MVSHTRSADNPHQPTQKLAFNEKLVGKGYTADTLLKKLKVLHTQLADLDQELVDVDSLSAVRRELMHTSILLHKDRGVKAYAACCLADILRLYAPDAPYTQSELRDIFQFFFKQLTIGLKGMDSAYYNEYFHLLESLSTVKSVVLVCDLVNAEELMTDIFRDFFGLIRRDLAKKIELFMADILVALIDECQTLPSEVLEVLMAQFVEENARMEQPAFRLAVQVCNATADKLQRHVCQYFTDIIVSHSQDEEMDEIRTAHDLIKRINRSCPSLLHSVVPQLEEELRVEDLHLRLMSTGVLGEMFSDKGGADSVKKYPTTWNVWLLRKNDKSAAIRLKFVESSRGCLINLPEQRDAIEEALALKLRDPDEKVRAAVCKVYSQLDYETALHHVTETQLRDVANRGVDKKHSVRVEAMNAIGRLYSLAYPEIENNDSAAIRHFSWIPTEILHMMSAGPEVRALAEQVITEYIFPLPSTGSIARGNDIDEAAWTDRLLNTMKYLDEKAIKALLSLTALKATRPTIYEHLIDACTKNNGGVIDDNDEAITRRLNAVIQRVAGLLSDSQRAAEDLHGFAKLNERRLYKLWTTCLDPQTDLRTLVKSTHDFLKRLDQLSPSISPTLSTVLRRSSLRIVSQSSIPTLLKKIQKSNNSTSGQAHALAANSQILLSFASKHCPALYKSHVAELTKAVADEKNTKLMHVSLQALASLMKWDSDLVPLDKRTTERVIRYALDSSAQPAKFAVRLLAHSKEAADVCSQVVESIAAGLPEAEPELLAAHVTVLAQIARLVPDAFERKSDAIIAFLLQKVLMVSEAPDVDAPESEEEWIEDDMVPPFLIARIQTLKVFRNRCLALSATETALKTAEPVIRVLFTLLEHGGLLSAEMVDDSRAKSRLRLQAAVSLLHLATVDVYASAIAPKLIPLAITAQDTCYHVRVIFLSKLVALLTPRKLPSWFNVIPFLTVHDPEEDVKRTASAYVLFAYRNMTTAQRVEHFELIFIRLLHFLAHHPDFSPTHEDLPDSAKYVEFYLDLLATSENVSLLHHLAAKAKTVRDADPETESENLYIMSELAQELIKIRCHSRSWNLTGYPGKVKLPADILRTLPDANTANKILKTVYLPDETIAWLADVRKHKPAGQPREKRERKLVTKRKAPARRSNGLPKRPRQRAKKRLSDESEDEKPSESEPSDVEMANGEGEQVTTSPDREPPVSGERLGRSARTRAKERIRKQAKSSRSKDESAMSETEE